MTKILITGCAGFIGSNLVDRLLSDGHEVIGIDNFDDYYNPKIKEENLTNADRSGNFKLYRADILDFDRLKNLFSSEKPVKILHLAARAGVRPSMNDPLLYGQVNVLGTVNLLKLAVDFKVQQFIFGSSSSVYGQTPIIPFGENDLCKNIISPYGASKRSAEFFVESFYHSFGLKSTILRFFSVYGPRGRPDMAPSLFTKAILLQKPINQFGDGSSSRDYTYIDDVIDGVTRVLNKEFDFEIINLGSDQPVLLDDFIKTLEKIIGKKAQINELPRQLGDVEKTWADITRAKKILEWAPTIKLEEGLKNYVHWYMEYMETYRLVG